jgi:hypothetical protein
MSNLGVFQVRLGVKIRSGSLNQGRLTVAQVSGRWFLADCTNYYVQIPCELSNANAGHRPESLKIEEKVTSSGKSDFVLPPT